MDTAEGSGQLMQGELSGLYTFVGENPLPERCSDFKKGPRNFGMAINCIIWWPSQIKGQFCVQSVADYDSSF
jgi:hypothetical protein